MTNRDEEKERGEGARWMRAAPQKESRLETEEELGEVREVIRREEWVRRGWTTPPPPGKDFCEDARSIESVSI